MRRKTLTTIALFAVALLPASVFAQTDRTGNWDFTFGALYQQGNDSTGLMGSTLDVDGVVGFGMNVGYNLNNHFNISADFDFLRPDYTAVLVDDSLPQNSTVIDHEFSQFNGRLKATWNILEGPLVPFVEAGFGWSTFDSNVTDGPPITGCWWHPYWGYICSNFYSTYSTTEKSYGGGLGLRYEFRGNSFLKLSYNIWELDYDSTRAEPQLESTRLEYGWRF